MLKFILKIFLTLSYPSLLTSNDLSLEVGDKCCLPSGAEGICKLDRDCLEPIKLFNSGGVQPTLCGFVSLSSIICCPKSASETLPTQEKFGDSVVVYRPAEPPIKTEEKCKLRDGSSGTCQFVSENRIFFNYLKRKNSRPIFCSDENIWPIQCYPDVLDETIVSDPSKERISVKKCKEYNPIKFEEEGDVTASEYGGESVELGKYPHMGALGWLFLNGSGYDWNCGASLISENFIITAAHCSAVPDTDSRYKMLEPVVVRLGKIYLSKSLDENDIPIAKIIIHPLYSPPNRYHDIALMQLVKSTTFSFAIKPICLHQSFSTSGVTIGIGWGKTSFHGSVSPDLLKVKLRVVKNEKCSTQYDHISSRIPDGIIDGQICAGHPLGEQDSCPGDSGGPLHKTDPELFFAETIFGITSFGIGCGKVKIPGVYTRISTYLDWIENVVWPNQ